MNKYGRLVMLVGLLGFAQTPVLQAMPMLGFDPGLQSFSAGNTVSVDILVSNIGTEIVSAYDLSVSYDDTLLNASNVTFSQNLGDSLNFEVLEGFNFSSGLAEFSSLSLLSDAELIALQSPLAGNVVLATLDLVALAAGDTASLAFNFTAGKDVKGANNQVIIPTALITEPDMIVLLLLAGLIAYFRIGAIQRTRAVSQQDSFQTRKYCLAGT